MIPDYDSFEDFTPGFELSSESPRVPDDEDFETVDRDVAELFEVGDDEEDGCEDD